MRDNIFAAVVTVVCIVVAWKSLGLGDIRCMFGHHDWEIESVRRSIRSCSRCGRREKYGGQKWRKI